MKLLKPIDAGGRWGLRLFKWFGPPCLSLARAIQHPATMYGQELVYERLFANALTRLGLENRYYATGGAASFSLLYLLLRAVTELPVRRVVECGCGQSSLLLDALQQLRPIEITTLEHDREWAQRIQQQVQYDITCANLVERVVRGRRISTYNTDAELDTPPDLLLVDGPQASPKYSRWGMLQWVERELGEDFLILFDDANRRGEIDTIEETLSLLTAQGRTFRTRFYYSVKWQFVVAGGEFIPATFF